MVLTIYNYGYIDSMFAILNAIAMLCNTESMTLLIHILSGSTMVYYILKAGASGNLQNMKFSLIKCLGLILLINSLLTQKTHMKIEDKVTNQIRGVDKLPYAFAIPVGYLEAFGYYLTVKFDQAFSVVGSMPYTQYGMTFGSRLVKEFKNQKVANPEFAYNSHNFIKRCLYDEARIGARFDFMDLESSDDLLSLVETKGGKFRKVDFREGVLSKRYNCLQAASRLRGYLDNELIKISNKYAGTDFGLAGTVGQAMGLDFGVGNQGSLSSILARNVQIAYGSTLGIDPKYDARSILQQNMMINAMHDHNGIVNLYASTKAQQQQESTLLNQSILAAENIPLYLAVFKGFTYAAFVFVLPMMLIGGGITSFYKNYLITVVSFQLWPPLNSVLNMFIEMYTANTASAASGITQGILSYSSYNQAYASADKIVAIAGGLQLAIMGLSLAIVRGGAGGLIHFASSLTSASAGAASMAASEAISGNRSMDNVNYGNLQHGMQSANKMDFNSSYASGASRTQMLDGSQQVVQQNGLMSVMSGAGINRSHGANKFDLSESTGTQLHQAFTQSQSLVESAEKAFHDSKTSTMNDVAELVSHIAERESKGETFNYESMGEQGKALQQAVNHAKSLHDNNGYEWAQAAQASVSTYTESGFNTPSFSPIKLNGGVKAEGLVSANNTSNQSLTESEGINRNNDTSKSFNNLIKAASNDSFTKENNIDTGFSETIRADYAQMQQYSENLSMRKEEADNYAKAISFQSGDSGNLSRDMFHEVEQQVMKDYGVDINTAHRMMDNNDRRVDAVWNKIVNSRVRSIMQEVQTGQDQIANSDKAMSEFANQNQHKVNKDSLLEVRQKAEGKGLNQDEIQKNINNQNTKLNAKYQNIQDNNNAQRKSVEQHNKVLEHGLQNRTDKYEKDRIGQGAIGSTLGIGGPNKEERSKANYNRKAPGYTLNNKK